MKYNKKQFETNAIDAARETYVKCYCAATDSIFCNNKEKLEQLNRKMIEQYYKTKRFKKLFRILVYVSCNIYNNEMIVNANLAYDLHILTAIVKHRLYKPHKFIQFVEQKDYLKCLVPGIKYSNLMVLINNILRGVEC